MIEKSSIYYCGVFFPLWLDSIAYKEIVVLVSQRYLLWFPQFPTTLLSNDGLFIKISSFKVVSQAFSSETYLAQCASHSMSGNQHSRLLQHKFLPCLMWYLFQKSFTEFPLSSRSRKHLFCSLKPELQFFLITAFLLFSFSSPVFTVERH